jgi:hypothetical protein
MKVILSGATGFIGKYLRHELCRRGHMVINFDLRALLCNGDPRIAVKEAMHRLADHPVFIHAAAVKSPKSKADSYFNEHLPSLLQQEYFSIAPSGTFVFISSLNVRVSQLNDLYTQQKRRAESSLVNKNTIIIRPSLVWSTLPEGERLLLEQYLNSIFPFRLVPFPGNYYTPIYVYELAKIIADTITAPAQHKEINVYGDKVVSFFELAELISIDKNITKLPIKYFKFIIKFAYLFKRYPSFNQLLPIDRSNILISCSDHNVVLPFE